MKLHACWFAIVALSGLPAVAAESIEVPSPNGNLVAKFHLAGGVPQWQLKFNGEPILETGRLGLQLGGNELGAQQTEAVDQSTQRETVATVWGKFAQYDNHFKQLLWTLRETSDKGRQLRIEVRVYDGGIALRYVFPPDGGWDGTIPLADDRTEFNFAGYVLLESALPDRRSQLDQTGVGNVGLAGVGCENHGRFHLRVGHAQSDALRVFSPTGFCEQVFVNMLAGPLDMCNGLYTLENPARDRPKIFTNVNTTVVAETARVMITFSGLAILPDCPEAYEAKADLFDYLSRLPMTWDETRILQGEIGQTITTARRSGRQWFVASATNEEARALSIRLDFLEPDQLYTATLYEDAPDAHYIRNREAYRVRQLEVKRGQTIDAAMAPGGGHCVYLQPRKRPSPAHAAG